MRIPSHLGYVLSKSVAVAVLAGCSGGARSTSLSLPQVGVGSGFITQSASRRVQISDTLLSSSERKATGIGGVADKGFITPGFKAPGGAQVFISAGQDGAIGILNSAGAITAALTQDVGFPMGLATDKSGNLYVANSITNNILIFKPPYDGTPTILNDPNEFPMDVAVDGNGNVAVTNSSDANFGAGDVALYLAGSTNPTSTISDVNFPEPQYCAFDSHGNLFLDGISPIIQVHGKRKANGNPAGNGNPASLGEILHGVHGTSITMLAASNEIVVPGSVQVSVTGQIAIDDSSVPAIYSYNAPSGQNLGSPVFTTHLTGSGLPQTFAFVPGSTRVLTADESLNAVQLFNYPAGGSPIKSRNLPPNAIPTGVAINPTEQFTLR